jgi:hypothetical protein
MFAEPDGIPSRAIAGGLKELIAESKDDRVEPGPLHLRREGRVMLIPDIVVKPLLSVILVSTDDGFLWRHRVHIVSGDGPKCGKERNRFWGRAQRSILTPGNGTAVWPKTG